MKKVIKDGYIIAFMPDGEVDSEYTYVLDKFNSAGKCKDGFVWVVDEGLNLVEIALPNNTMNLDTSAEYINKEAE